MRVEYHKHSGIYTLQKVVSDQGHSHNLLHRDQVKKNDALRARVEHPFTVNPGITGAKLLVSLQGVGTSTLEERTAQLEAAGGRYLTAKDCSNWGRHHRAIKQLRPRILPDVHHARRRRGAPHRKSLIRRYKLSATLFGDTSAVTTILSAATSKGSTSMQYGHMEPQGKLDHSNWCIVTGGTESHVNTTNGPNVNMGNLRRHVQMISAEACRLLTIRRSVGPSRTTALNITNINCSLMRAKSLPSSTGGGR